MSKASRRAARSVFLKELVSAFVLAMRYFFKPKATLSDRCVRI
jgi:hypothetical protein